VLERHVRVHAKKHFKKQLAHLSQIWYIGFMEFDVKVLPPAHNFIQNLPEKMRAKTYRGIDLLKLFGYRLGEPHSKPLKNADGLKELRIKLATNIIRLFYFHFRDKFYVVTSGYAKKKDKTDEGEIERALKIRNEFIQENIL
jgi:phage-related protein